MSLFNLMIRNRHLLTTAKNTVLTVLLGKESSMARKVPSLCSVLMMITALILAVPAQAELQLFFVHNDHLSTPKYLTDTTGKAIWQAQATPFGDVTEKEDLDGDGKYVTLNMRFPGQYWDHEMGTSYNYFRDYDPSLGRYLQSDPIGLEGGINTYTYVSSSPVGKFDFYALAEMCNAGFPFSLSIPHTFLCVGDTCGGKHGGGQGRSLSTSDSAIKDDSKYKSDASCNDIPDHGCDSASFDQCITVQIQAGRLNEPYNWSTTNCGTWATETITKCWSVCEKTQ